MGYRVLLPWKGCRVSHFDCKGCLRGTHEPRVGWVRFWRALAFVVVAFDVIAVTRLLVLMGHS